LEDKELLPAARRATPHRGQYLRPGDAGSAMFWAGSDSISWCLALVDMDFVGEACRVSARRPRYFSLLRQRKVPKRKASRSPGRCAVPCAARFAGDARKLASLKQCAPLFPALLRCSARPHGRGTGTGARFPKRMSSLRAPRIGLCPAAGFASWGVTRRRRGAVPVFCRHVLASSTGPGGAGLALSERSEFSQTPPGPSNAVCPQQSGGTAHSAAFSFAYFSLGKQRKVRRPPGRDPACHARKNHSRKTK
jgi:hypothetical protein